MDIGSLLAGGLLGGIFSWRISSHFHKKSSRELEEKVQTLSNELNGKPRLINFERALVSSTWSKEFAGMNEYYVCDSNTNLQFHLKDDSREFYEPWLKPFPDPNTSQFSVEIKIDGCVVKSLQFISADGGRYYLPLPKLECINEQPDYYWHTQSIDYKIAEVIGNFYKSNSLKEVANFLKIGLI